LSNRSDRQQWCYLDLGRAQRGGIAAGPVTDGQVRHYIGLHATEWRELRKRGMNHISQRPERPSWLRRQPDNILAEPADTGELAVEATH